MNGNLRDKILQAVHALPPMSKESSSILNLLYDEKANASEIEHAVRYDPGLTANLLKISNSAYFGFPGRISSVSQAVTQLGWKRVYQIVIASTLSGLMDTHVPGYDLEKGDLWRHSVAVAVTAESLAKRCHARAADETFTAALLHDVGKLVLGHFIASEKPRVNTAIGTKIPFTGIERDILGTDHAEAGAWILKYWSLPAELVSAVRWHHEPDGADEHTPILDIVHVADMLCLMMGFGLGCDALQYCLSFKATERLKIRNTDLEAIGARTLDDAEGFLQAVQLN